MKEEGRMREYTWPTISWKGSIIPVVEAYLTKAGDQLTFYCPYCKRWHFHGPMEGNRGPHCYVEDVPWRWTGYWLKYVGILTSEIKKNVPKAYRKPRGTSQNPNEEAYNACF